MPNIPAESPTANSERESHGAELTAELHAQAETLFGARLPIAERYARLLATTGIERGLLGPREAPRIWDRHILNCAAVAELLAKNSSVVDVGSGAGLPGIVLAVARPDLSITLLEPLLRRERFLREVVTSLELSNVDVMRARAEDVTKEWTADTVTARAVAPLDRLVQWCFPLLRRGGRLLAIKGNSAQREIVAAKEVLRKHRARGVRRVECGTGTVSPAVVVVEVTK